MNILVLLVCRFVRLRVACDNRLAIEILLNLREWRFLDRRTENVQIYQRSKSDGLRNVCGRFFRPVKRRENRCKLGKDDGSCRAPRGHKHRQVSNWPNLLRYQTHGQWATAVPALGADDQSKRLHHGAHQKRVESS